MGFGRLRVQREFQGDNLMAHCTKCGAQIGEGAAFCLACGAAQTPGAAATPAPIQTGAPAQSQMAENVAGLLCYVLGWITGLIFYFVDKRPFVRFHAAQSIIVFGGLHVIYFVLAAFFGMSMMTGGMGSFSMGFALYGLIDLVGFILWILLMVKAYQGERFRVPVAADLAEKLFGKA
jgi:uncharacterized membrane protein